MPNTKSAAKRVRSSSRKAAQNQATKSRVRTAERKFKASVAAGKATDAKVGLTAASSAYSKAAKLGVIKARTASRKRSRLQLALNRLAAKPAAAATATATATVARKKKK